MTVTDTLPKPKSPRWVKALLVVSLALNLLFVGATAGFLLRTKDARENIARDGAHMLARALPRDQRRDLIREFRQQREEISDQFLNIREQRRKIIEVLEQIPFDPDALLLVLGEQRAWGGQVATLGHELVVSRLADMSDEERREVARNLRKGPNKDARQP